MKFYEFLTERRLKLNISQKTLAEELGYKTGQYISNIERGVCPFPASKIYDLSKLIQIEPEKIVFLIVKDIRAEYLASLKEQRKSAR